MNIDIDRTRDYYRTHSLCDCSCCRNLYAQIKERLPLLDKLLSEFGIDSARPDEVGSTEENDGIDYLFVSYTVCGKIESHGKYTLKLTDGDMPLEIVVGDYFVPNEQKGDYFVVGVYGIKLPWVLDEPFPIPVPAKSNFREKIKVFFRKCICKY